MIENNPLSKLEYDRLIASIQWSERQLEMPKRNRISAIRQLVGFHYAQYGAFHRVPVPLLALAAQIYVRNLAAQEPRVLVTTQKPELKPTAKNFELALNQIPDEIGLSATLRKFVLEALFSMGIVKVGLHTVDTILHHEYGQPFVDLVPLDNYFLDMSAKSMDEISYEGNQYWLDYKEVMEGDWLKGEAKDSLIPDEYTVVGVAGERRAEEISADSSADQYRDRCWLRDIWLPREQVVLTVGAQTNKLLKVTEWEGPKNGPFVKLGYNDVPGNLLPLPPIALWRDLHELANKLFRKLGQQAEDQKTVLGFLGGNDESVEAFKNAKDGEGINYTGGTPQKLEAGGVVRETMAFEMQCRDLLSYFAGNLDSLGGLAKQAPTLGQDKLLSAASGAQMRDMVDATVKAIQEIFYALAHYEWTDPVKRRQLEKPIPGTSLSLPITFGKKERKGKFDMYDLRIDAYSLQDNSPGVRLQKLNMIMAEYVEKLAPFIKESGGTIDFPKVFELVARYADFPELSELVVFSDNQPGPGVDRGSSQPANTQHTTTRVGEPGQSRQGANANMEQILMGGNGRQTAGDQGMRSGGQG